MSTYQGIIGKSRQSSCLETLGNVFLFVFLVLSLTMLLTDTGCVFILDKLGEFFNFIFNIVPAHR